MPIKRISDKKLFALAAQQKAAKLRENEAKAEAKTLSDQIIPQMQDRKVKALESEDGTIRVNKVEGEYTEYDVDAMREHLSPTLFKKCTTEVPNPEAIVAMITAGKIKSSTLKKFAKTQAKAPYIIVTLKEGK